MARVRCLSNFRSQFCNNSHFSWHGRASGTLVPIILCFVSCSRLFNFHSLTQFQFFWDLQCLPWLRILCLCRKDWFLTNQEFKRFPNFLCLLVFGFLINFKFPFSRFPTKCKRGFPWFSSFSGISAVTKKWETAGSEKWKKTEESKNGGL